MFYTIVDQHYYNQNYWTRLYPVEASRNFSEAFCGRKTNGYIFKKSWSYSFFDQYSSAYNIDLDYWLGKF